jgi:predicted MFS family arabinose efflux permease
MAVGPSFVALWATVGDLSPDNLAAETQSWISSFMSLGGAVGAAASGVVVQALGPGALLALAAVALALASGLAHLAISSRTMTSEQVPGVDTRRAVNSEVQ